MVDKDELLDHNYDGIKEYDNNLPRWWVNLFWITIIYGVIYGIWFHLPSTPTPSEQLAKDMGDLAAMHAAADGSAAGDASEDKLIALAANTTAVAHGKEIFVSKCVVCHGPDGQGVVGPNLTDKYWIHGGKITEIRNTVSEGVPAKGMLTWKTMLTPEDINAVVAYVWTLRGTTPANPKAPEGQLAN